MLRLQFFITSRMQLTRLSDHISQKLLSEPWEPVRVLPTDLHDIVASVKRPPIVMLHHFLYSILQKKNVFLTADFLSCAQSHLIDAATYIIEALEGDCNEIEAVRLLETALYVIMHPLSMQSSAELSKPSFFSDHFTTANNISARVPSVMWYMGRVEAEIARRKPFCT